jgi:hypothetical protein
VTAQLFALPKQNVEGAQTLKVLGVTGSTAASPLAVLMCSKSKCEHEGASGDEAQRV